MELRDFRQINDWTNAKLPLSQIARRQSDNLLEEFPRLLCLAMEAAGLLLVANEDD